MIRITQSSWLRTFSRRGENWRRIALVTVYGGIGTVALVFGQSTIGLIALIGFVHELNQMEIVKLRAEIRAKKMWHGGQQ